MEFILLDGLDTSDEFLFFHIWTSRISRTSRKNEMVVKKPYPECRECLLPFAYVAE